MTTVWIVLRILVPNRRRNPWRGRFLGLGPDYGRGKVARFREGWSGRVFVLNFRSTIVRYANLWRYGRDTSEEEAALVAMVADQVREGLKNNLISA